MKSGAAEEPPYRHNLSNVELFLLFFFSLQVFLETVASENTADLFLDLGGSSVCLCATLLVSEVSQHRLWTSR